MGQSPVQGIIASGSPATGDGANAVVSGKITAVGPQPAFPFQGWSDLAIFASYNTTLTTAAGSLAATATAIGAIVAGTAINSSVVPPGTTAGAVVGSTITLALPTLTFWGVLDASGKISGLPSTQWLIGATVAGPNVPNGATVTGIVTPAVPAVSGQNAPPTPGVVQLSAVPTALAPNNFPQPFTFALAAAGIAAGADANAIFTGTGISYVGSVQLERSFDGGATWTIDNLAAAGTAAVFAGGGNINTTFGEPEKGVLYRLNCTAYTSGVINYRLSGTGYGATALGAGPQL